VSTLAVAAERIPVRRRGQAYIVLAALAWSTAGLLQRELSVGTATQVAGRAVFAALALLVFVAAHDRGWRAFATLGRAELAVAVLTAIASGTFIVALNHATVANVLFMQAVSPIIAAVIAWAVLHEAIGKRTAFATAAAVAGVGVMAGGPGRPGALGLGLSILMTFSFAVALVITRHRRDISMAPAICLSQVIVLVAFAPFAHPGSASLRDLGLMVTLGVTQIGLGLAFMTMGARLIAATEVALISLLEVVLGPLWVWLALSERPSNATFVGGAIVVGAVVLQATNE
jgi:drug/metabolite transporter (DMT)-like permease